MIFNRLSIISCSIWELPAFHRLIALLKILIGIPERTS